MTKRQPFPSRTATVVARTTAAAVQGERRAARVGNHAPGPPARVTRRGRWRVGGREVASGGVQLGHQPADTCVGSCARSVTHLGALPHVLVAAFVSTRLVAELRGRLASLYQQKHFREVYTDK
jgi:hypothetical protein